MSLMTNPPILPGIKLMLAGTVLQGPDGPRGRDGLNAYEVWKLAGNTGTVDEFLLSLIGEKGDAGAKVELQTSATHVQWRYASDTVWIDLIPLEDLRGPQGLHGEQGLPGLNGTDGVNGTDGADGINGTNGVDGKSAYQVALDGGFVGSQSQWLASLVGPKGDKGDAGTSFKVDATALFSQRSTYDAQPDGFSFLAADTGMLYFRVGVSGWSAPIPFGKGDQGLPGANGKEVQLQKTATHIQWRYVGEAVWIDLIPIEDLRGPQGTQGEQGLSGPAGTTTWAGITDKPAVIAAGADAPAARSAIGLGNVDNTSDANKPVSAAQAAAISASTSANIHAAPSKTAPADADELGYLNSVSSFGLVKMTWANLKTWLGGLFVSKSGGTMTGNLNVPSINGGQIAGFRNKLINGKMEISQRNGGTVMALTATPTYFNDRWSCISSATPAGTLFTGRTTIVGALGSAQTGDGFSHCLYFQRQSGSYAGIAKVIQVLETAESRSLAGRTVTLSFWAAVGAGWLGGDITAAVVTGTGTDQSAAQFFAGTATSQATAGSVVVTPNTTLTRYSLQVTIPAGVTQVAVFFQNASWSGSGSSSDIVAITGVQLEVGSVATPFEHRPYGLELALCQRYLPVVYAGSPINGMAISTTGAYLNATFHTPPRVSPIGIISGSSGVLYNSNGVSFAITGVTWAGATGLSGSTLQFSVASGLAAGNGTFGFSNSNILFTGCEL